MRTSTGLLRAAMLAIAAAGCAAPAGYAGFFAEKDPLESFEMTKKTCNEEAEFRDAQGTPWINWEKFDECAGKLGWTRRHQ